MDGSVEKISVQTTTVDELCRAEGIVPTFIKVDVEGHEPALFRGARETIRRHRPLLVFEFWETWWEKGFAELFDELDANYHLVRIQDGANVAQFYHSHQSDKTVDIAALPRRRAMDATHRGQSAAGRWLSSISGFRRSLRRAG